MPKMIATKTTSGEIHLFDYYKHSGSPTTDEVKPELRLLDTQKKDMVLTGTQNKQAYS